jgi:hypothetical protein
MSAQGEVILAWLKQAISEREDVARAAEATNPSPWTAGRAEDTSVTHIASNDPASVLRRCAADRKLLELHGSRGHSCPAYDYDGDLDEYARFYDHEVCPVVKHLADSYGWTAGQTPPSEGDQVT